MTTQASKADEIFWRALEDGSADERRRVLPKRAAARRRSGPTSRAARRVPEGRAIPRKPAAEVGVTIGQPVTERSARARRSAATSCCSRSAKAAWASSSWPSRPSRSSARWR